MNGYLSKAVVAKAMGTKVTAAKVTESRVTAAKVTATHFAHGLRRHRCGIGFAAVALLAGGWAQLWLAAQHHRQPPHAKQQYATVYSRAAQICSALSSGCTMDPHPVFSEHRSRFYAGDRTPLRMWKFNCQLDGRPTWLIFNDNTASLCYLIAERPDTLKPESNGVHTIRNRAEAAEAGFQQLKAMKLVGRGMQVALTVPPRINPMGTTWLMTWSVTPDVGAAPYTVRLELDRSNGNPISMADTGSLDAASDTVPHS